MGTVRAKVSSFKKANTSKCEKSEDEILIMTDAEKKEAAAFEYVTTGMNQKGIEKKYGLEEGAITDYLKSSNKKALKVYVDALRTVANKEVAIISRAQNLMLRKIEQIESNPDLICAQRLADLGSVVASSAKSVSNITSSMAYLEEIADKDVVKIESKSNPQAPQKFEDIIDG